MAKPVQVRRCPATVTGEHHAPGSQDDRLGHAPRQPRGMGTGAWYPNAGRDGLLPVRRALASRFLPPLAPKPALPWLPPLRRERRTPRMDTLHEMLIED